MFNKNKYKILNLLLVFILIVILKQNEFYEQKTPIKNIIIIVQENHSFDSYFGTYPGANGLNLSKGLPSAKGERELVKPVYSGNSSFLKSVMAYNEFFDTGREDSNGMVRMDYFDRKDIPNYWTYADNFVLLDNLFSAVMVRYSIPSQLYMFAATAEGWMTNAQEKEYLTSKTIIDLLQSKNISWKYYTAQRVAKFTNKPEGWYLLLQFKHYMYDNDIANIIFPLEKYFSMEKKRLPELSWASTLLQFKRSTYDDEVVKNIQSLENYFQDLENETLPQVSWVFSSIENSEHPPYDIRKGMNFVTGVINALMKSRYWNNSAVFIVWDDYGFFNDHVKPKMTDEFGPGPRVPGLIVSPYAKNGYIDHTLYNTSSPLKFIEENFGLPSLTERDGKSENMFNAFDFKQKPRSPLILPAVPIEK